MSGGGTSVRLGYCFGVWITGASSVISAVSSFTGRSAASTKSLFIALFPGPYHEGRPALIHASCCSANIGEDLLHSLSRDDIKDLFPGPANFLRRRAIWLVVNDEGKVETTAEILQPSPPRNSDLSNEEPNTSMFVTMSNPKCIVFTDSELELARHSYFEQKRLGNEHVPLSKELFCRLIRNTMTNMISIARASEDCRYPSKHEVNTMAKRLVEYYPMIKN
ncbi:uncharacterized protein LOC117493165 [Trematomus bernacchii]|uniref:uncharacterized protein LOC117493165 n=1 Tax=Trematomus bernacchii TaxID=40690 RepID=UPI001469FAEF|nr:uncharacterized protein LOC117493165 [Trematomus bernacchii]